MGLWYQKAMFVLGCGFQIIARWGVGELSVISYVSFSWLDKPRSVCVLALVGGSRESK